MIKKIAPLLIIFAALLWSLDGILRRELRAIPAATLVMLEHFVGLCILLPFIPKAIGKFREIKTKEWLILLLVSIIGGAALVLHSKAALLATYRGAVVANVCLGTGEEESVSSGRLHAMSIGGWCMFERWQKNAQHQGD